MINVGIVGIGFMGMMHYLAYQKLTGVRVAAVCEKIPERLKGDWTKIKGNFGPPGQMMDLSGVATYSELDEMLKNPELDLIDICLPPFAHSAAAITALNAGKNVFCEKPITLKMDEADSMLKAAEKSGSLLMIGHVLPFFPSHAFVYEAAKSQKYGKLLGGHFNRVISDPTWLNHFYDMDVCGGPMLDLHVHDAHFIRLLFGMPKSVHSVGRVRGKTPEYFQTQFLFDDPDIVVTAVSGTIQQQGRPFTHGYEVHFEKATILHESFMGMPVTVLTEDGRVEKPELPGFDEVEIFSHELAEVINAVKAKKNSDILGAQLARDALLLCHNQIESILRTDR